MKKTKPPESIQQPKATSEIFKLFFERQLLGGYLNECKKNNTEPWPGKIEQYNALSEKIDNLGHNSQGK